VYLNELDQFVKHELNIKYYIRYVDDFVIFHRAKEVVEEYKEQINIFLREKLALELHPHKSKIRRLKQGTTFLGYRIFFYHKLLRKSNKKKFERKIKQWKEDYNQKEVAFDQIKASFYGWYGYAKNANTYNHRKKIAERLRKEYPHE
jgi:replicative DNA helicase